MGDPTVTVISIQDRWNATNERTIDGQDGVNIQVTDEDGNSHVEQISVSQFLSDDRFQDKYGSSDDRLMSLQGFQAVSLQNQPITMSLSAKDKSDHYTRAILGVVKEVEDVAVPMVEALGTIGNLFGGTKTETPNDTKKKDETKNDEATA